MKTAAAQRHVPHTSGAKRGNLLVEAFDVVFIMLLCFGTLLTTMLMRGKVLVGSGSSGGIDYSFSWITLFLTGAALLAYLVYVLAHSDKELRVMIAQLYQSEPAYGNLVSKDLEGRKVV